jgi:hypothetical protein
VPASYAGFADIYARAVIQAAKWTSRLSSLTVIVVFVGHSSTVYSMFCDDGDLMMGSGALQADANSANGQENSGMSEVTTMLYLQLLQQQQAMFANPLGMLL